MVGLSGKPEPGRRKQKYRDMNDEADTVNEESRAAYRAGAKRLLQEYLKQQRSASSEDVKENLADPEKDVRN